MADNLSRRDFLKLAWALSLYACAPRSVKKGFRALEGHPRSVEPDTEMELDVVEPKPESDVQLRLGQEKSINMEGLEWYPDTRTSYIKKGDSFDFYFSAGREGYVASGSSIESLGSRRKVIEPSLATGKFGIEQYRSPGTVFEDGKGITWSIDHREEWKDEASGTAFTARIGLSKSIDGGKMWTDSGIILDGQAAEVAGTRITGAGQPSAIIGEVNGVPHVYMYYTDWGVGADSIHLARVPLSQIEDPYAWRKNYYGGFDSNALGGMSSPVIAPEWGEAYTALPSVSWNDHIGKYLSVFETSTGFNLATSGNGIDWANHQQIAAFPEAHNERKTGSTWYSYPSLLSPDTGDQFVTGNKGILVYSAGIYGVSANKMKIREFSIT